MMQSEFNPKAYYVLYNANSPNLTLSSGISQSTSGEINMTVENTYSSSENWQLFYQKGRYFMRNYDYGGEYQLGLASTSDTTPKLMRRNGSLGQQWNLIRGSDNKWRFMNGLLGNASMLALTGKNMVPGMQASDKGTGWDILINPSVGEPEDSQMYTAVDDFEEPKAPMITNSSSAHITMKLAIPTMTSSTKSSPILSATPLTISPSTNAPASPLSTSDSTPVLTPSPTNSTTDIPSQNHKSPLSEPGVITGVATGAAALVIMSGLLVFFFFKRRREKMIEARRQTQHSIFTNPDAATTPSQWDFDFRYSPELATYPWSPDKVQAEPRAELA
ncbi:hypothetical protein BS50DRAFT_623943 [Corynespora cassiicola Philippines]|uniref:Uncharacterized protein n=1 Tax=Corynespora cassiicola Philippines TaxID=1448308 RepID=A0A2T2NCG9_CORCC|nr:hypothetical protein BS50DRAFT_623943 [Corynespora cassiicola Philippines]